MAVDICSEISSLPISPRISFSHDLNQVDQQDHHHHYNDRNLDRNSVSDFDFCVTKNDDNFTFEFSTADELFSGGKILPIQIKAVGHGGQKPSDHRDRPYPAPENDNSTKKIRLKEILSSSYDTDDDEDNEENDDSEKPRRSSGGGSNNYMSFWKFRRSSSLNFEKIKSLHFISRSNSTGSTQPNKKPSLRKQQSANSSSTSSSSSTANHSYKRSSSFSGYYSHTNSSVNLSSKSFPRNNNSNNCNGGSQYYGNCNNGVRVSPVLNLPQPYISRVTISFFGFGSLFCNGKVRKKKKK